MAQDIRRKSIERAARATSTATIDLVERVNGKICENRRFTNDELSNEFLEISHIIPHKTTWKIVELP